MGIKSTRVKILLVSCWISSIIAGFFVVGMLYQLFIGNAGNAVSSILTSAFFLIFLLQGGIVLYLVNKYYPASDIPPSQFVFHRIITVLVVIEMVFVVMGVVGLMLMESNMRGFGTELQDPVILGVFIALLLVFVSQVYILFVGSSVVNKIRDDYRKQLIENW